MYFLFRLCHRYDIIQKLLWVTMTHLPTDRVEVPIGLVAQLSYYQESKNSNSNRRSHVNILLLAARKTISQMLMEDVQVTISHSNLLLLIPFFLVMSILC